VTLEDHEVEKEVVEKDCAAIRALEEDPRGSRQFSVMQRSFVVLRSVYRGCSRCGVRLAGGCTCLHVVLIAPLCGVVCVHPLRVTPDGTFRENEVERRHEIEEGRWSPSNELISECRVQILRR
jgi:hypothetical protein